MGRNFISREANVVLRIYKTLIRPCIEYVEGWGFLEDVIPSASFTVYNTICSNTHIYERKLTKTTMLKKQTIVYFITTRQITKNTLVVMFINLAMYRGVCVCM